MDHGDVHRQVISPVPPRDEDVRRAGVVGEGDFKAGMEARGGEDIRHGGAEEVMACVETGVGAAQGVVAKGVLGCAAPAARFGQGEREAKAHAKEELKGCRGEKRACCD